MMAVIFTFIWYSQWLEYDSETLISPLLWFSGLLTLNHSTDQHCFNVRVYTGS